MEPDEPSMFEKHETDFTDSGRMDVMQMLLTTKNSTQKTNGLK
jgi:hypothetical protein